MCWSAMTGWRAQSGWSTNQLREELMRRKNQFLMATLCAFSMTINSIAVIAQGQDKKQEPRSNTQQAPEPPTFDYLMEYPATGAAFHFAFADAGQDVAFAAPQVEFIHHEFSFDSKTVKGAPYSAEAVTETIQTLGDGNRIIRNSSSKIYRDGAGRTRREQAMKAVGPWAVSGEAPIMITINDPVAGIHYSLNTNTKIAHKMAAARMFFHGGDANTSAEFKAKMKDKIKMKAANGGEAGAVVSGVVTDVVTETVTGAVAGAVGSGVAMSAGERVFTYSSDAEVNRESLGTQTIEGVGAEGTRTTFTIAAGKIGNERPIVTVNERWYSPELQTVVLSKNSDPRMGETTYRLTNILRSEPDPSLFQVPAEYTVKEGGFGFRTGGPPEQPRGFIERKRRPNDN
jgi:hypothetical protein